MVDHSTYAAYAAYADSALLGSPQSFASEPPPNRSAVLPHSTLSPLSEMHGTHEPIGWTEASLHMGATSSATVSATFETGTTLRAGRRVARVVGGIK